MTLPAKIGQTKCKIETEVVPANIPMLLSKASLKKASAVLDTAHDKATMFKQPVKLELKSSGHYCVNLRDENNQDIKETQSEEEILIDRENMTTKEKEKIHWKLHRQFGHASVDRLQKLLACSGTQDKESGTILQNIVKN